MTLPTRIRVMPRELSLKIAAGEVVERPASAVKELLDNAIDAGATTVRVEVHEAGLHLIRVIDDGCGMRTEDLPLAFTSHATSKITNLNDLENLSTLGFRGEALPSIAAVSRVEVQTRTEEDAHGSHCKVEFGEVIKSGVASVPRGTRISISDLFVNVPARRKFVRSLRAESSRIQQVVMEYALAQPAIRFALTIDGRQAFESSGSGRLADALAAAHGPDILESMIAVDGAGRDIRIVGLTSRPTLSRQNRSSIHVFVNGRPIANRSLAFALEEAYSGFLMVGRHPLAAIHISVAPTDVDVNIHPAKSEVRFARERDVHGVLYRAVTDALLEMRMETRQLGALSDSGQPELPAEQGSRSLAIAPESESHEPAPLIPDTPALRVFGQSNRTFIVAEGPNGLYMIDQHAAHERILYDRLQAQLTEGAVTVQPLLEPAAVELTPAHMQTLEENSELLAQAGFTLEPFGDNTCLIRTVPAIASTGAPSEVVIEILGDLQSVGQPGTGAEKTLATIACKAAVKAGQVLDLPEMREIVTQLERTLRPSTCPHGRPTMIHLSHSQLEREFGRR